MSALDTIANNLEKLPDILNEYDELIDEEAVALQLSLKGKVLTVANAEQSAWLFYYKARKAEVHAIVKFLEGKLAALRGRFFKQYTEHYQRELSDRQKDKYIDNEPQVADMLEIYLRVKELYEKYEAVVDAFEARGFALKNITELRIRSMEDAII